MKKKQGENYTANMQDKIIKKILTWKEIVFAISAVVVAILNLWLGFKLVPLEQSISEIRVQANENKEELKEHKDNNKEDLKEIKETLSVMSEDIKTLIRECR